MYWLLVALGLIERSLKVAFVLAPVVITSYLIGFNYGPKGVAFAYSTAMTLWMLPHLAWCVHGTPISFKQIVATLARPLFSGLVAVAVAAGGQHLYGHLLVPIVRLLIGGAILTSSYAVVLLYGMGQRDLYVDIWRGMRRGSSPPAKLLASV